MCKRNSPDKKKKKKKEREKNRVFKRNSPDQNGARTKCARESPQIKKRRSMGRVRETPLRKVKRAQDV